MDALRTVVGLGALVLYAGLFVVGFVWTWKLTRGLRLDILQPKDAQPPAYAAQALWPIRFFVAVIVGLIASAPAYLLAVVLDAADR
jgi:hypothetical protein